MAETFYCFNQRCHINAGVVNTNDNILLHTGCGEYDTCFIPEARNIIHLHAGGEEYHTRAAGSQG